MHTHPVLAFSQFSVVLTQRLDIGILNSSESSCGSETSRFYRCSGFRAMRCGRVLHTFAIAENVWSNRD